MSSHAVFSARFSARNRFIPALGLLVAQALACSGGNEFTASNGPDGSSASEDSSRTTIVANPNADSNDASASPSGSVDATAGLPLVDASVTDAADAEAGVGATDASGPDALICPTVALACDGGCITNDLNNCGACGKMCAVPANGTATCTASAATYACGIACSTSYTRCGASCANLQIDANNCGTCGHSCGPGKCASGKCQPWVVTVDDGALRTGWAAGLVADKNYIAWISSNGIKESPVQGGTPILLVPQTNQQIYNLAMASGVVAWTIGNANGGFDIQTATEGTINPAAAGSAVPNSMSTGSSICTPRGLALTPDGTTAYFILDCGNTAQLYQCDLTSFQFTSLFMVTPANPALGNAGNDVAFANGFVYWTDSAGGYVRRYSPTSQANEAVANTQLPYRLATDSAYIYWAIGSSNGTFAISRVSQTNLQNGGTVVAPLAGSLSAIATDGTDVYLADSRDVDGGLAVGLDYVPVAGGANPLALFASATDNPFGVVAAGGAVYWLSLTNATGHVTLYGQRFP